MNLKEIQQKTERYLLDLVKRTPLSFTHGQGAYLFDTEGKRYLDFLCGVATTSLGHSHPDIVDIIQKQSSKLVHVSNLFYNQQQAELAELLIRKSLNHGQVFFFNSGTEANEAAFKLSRSYGQKHKKGASVSLSLQNSFHGRTTASMCLTGQENIRNGFGPLLTEHIYLPRNDLAALEQQLRINGDKICAFFVELIQGEGGIYPLDREYVLQAHQLCQKHEVLFVIDEVQTGIGRTGKLFCYEHYGIEPDLMTLAKALGSGFPIGALIANKTCCGYLQRGQHGTTLGGNPLACAVATKTLQVIERDKLLPKVKELSTQLLEGLHNLQQKFPIIREIRGLGFHIGMELEPSASDFVTLCRTKGLLTNATSNNTVRIMPPLILNKQQLDEGLHIMEEALTEINAN